MESGKREQLHSALSENPFEFMTQQVSSRDLQLRENAMAGISRDSRIHSGNVQAAHGGTPVSNGAREPSKLDTLSAIAKRLNGTTTSGTNPPWLDSSGHRKSGGSYSDHHAPAFTPKDRQDLSTALNGLSDRDWTEFFKPGGVFLRDFAFNYRGDELAEAVGEAVSDREGSQVHVPLATYQAAVDKAVSAGLRDASRSTRSTPGIDLMRALLAPADKKKVGENMASVLLALFNAVKAPQSFSNGAYVTSGNSREQAQASFETALGKCWKL